MTLPIVAHTSTHYGREAIKCARTASARSRAERGAGDEAKVAARCCARGAEEWLPSATYRESMAPRSTAQTSAAWATTRSVATKNIKTGSDSALTVLHKWEVQGTDATQLKLKVSKGEGFELAAASGVGVICVRGCKGARKP